MYKIEISFQPAKFFDAKAEVGLVMRITARTSGDMNAVEPVGFGC